MTLQTGVRCNRTPLVRDDFKGVGDFLNVSDSSRSGCRKINRFAHERKECALLRKLVGDLFCCDHVRREATFVANGLRNSGMSR